MSKPHVFSYFIYAVILLLLSPFLPIYIFISFLFPIIKVNKNLKHENQEIEIFLVGDEIHTDIVIAKKHFNYDFYGFDSQIKEKKYVSYGWGDKGFYIETRTWKNLHPKTLFKAIFGINDVVMKVCYLNLNDISNKKIRKIKINKDQLKTLVEYILDNFSNFLPIENSRYTQFDNFYPAKGRYSIFNTCNNWVNNALKKINIKTSIWTASNFFIFD